MNLKNVDRALVLRPRVILLISLLLVGTVLILGSLSFKATRDAAFHEFNQQQLVKAGEAVIKIENYFATLSWALNAIGEIYGVHHFDERATRQVLALEIQELNRMGVKEIGVIDSQGTLRFIAQKRYLEGADFSEKKYFQRVKEMSPADAYTIALIDSNDIEDGSKEILIAVPLFKNPVDVDDLTVPGRSGGVVFCTFGFDHFVQDLIAPLNSSKGGHALLTDDQFRVLWMPDTTFIGKNLYNEAAEYPSFQKILEKMGSGLSGTGMFSFRKFDQAANKFVEETEKKFFAYEQIRLGQHKWVLGLLTPKKDAEKLIQSPYLKHIILLLLIILATILGFSYTTAMAFRYNKNLKMEVDTKTKEFQESHLRLLTVLDSLDAAVFVADPDTCEILFVNHYLCNLNSDIAGKPCWQLLNVKQSESCDFCKDDKLSLDCKSNGPHIREYQALNTGKWFQIRDRSIRWVDGRTVRLAIAEDITERKQTENELKRAHHEMGTFCRIIKEIGAQTTLDGIGSFLMKELNNILAKHEMRLFIFNGNRDLLFALTNRKTEIFKEPKLVQNVSTILENLNGITISPKKIFTHPLIPADFPVAGPQTIVPLHLTNHADGALVIGCDSNCRCEEKELELVALILEQAAGTIKRAIKHEEEIHYLQRRIDKTSEYGGIIGKDPKMQVVYKLIDDIAPSDASVLIQGDSGTGKELVANAIHRKSLRKDNPFVVINCSAYPSTLIESELFGHEKGAFTGAVRQKMGRFEQADNGTIFLDEIGEVPPSVQIKLLRVLQAQKFERVGGNQTIKIDVRILAATNKDLLQEVKNGHFREDLFYRLNVIPIKLPPLRLRRNDIPMLARHFQKEFVSELGEHNNVQDFSYEAMRALLDYDWPGNVRELENSIEHAVVLSKGSRIELSHLPSALASSRRQAMDTVQPKRTIFEHEKRLLSEVMEECGWNKSQAARQLGISRSTLYDKLKKYQVVRPSATIH